MKDNVCIVYIPVTHKEQNRINKLCDYCIKLLNYIYHFDYSFEFSKIPIEEVNKNVLYDRGKDSLISKYPDIIKKYWDYEKNEKLNITPHLVTPLSHHKVYFFVNNGESKLY